MFCVWEARPWPGREQRVAPGAGQIDLFLWYVISIRLEDIYVQYNSSFCERMLPPIPGIRHHSIPPEFGVVPVLPPQ